MEIISNDNQRVSKTHLSNGIIVNFRKHLYYTATDFVEFLTVCKIIDIREKCQKQNFNFIENAKTEYDYKIITIK